VAQTIVVDAVRSKLERKWRIVLVRACPSPHNNGRHDYGGPREGVRRQRRGGGHWHMNNVTSVGQGLSEQWSLPEETEEKHAQTGARAARDVSGLSEGMPEASLKSTPGR
jgi:hypothetical protein